MSRPDKLAELDRQLREGLPTPAEAREYESKLNSVVTDAEVARNVCYALNTGNPEFSDYVPNHDRIVSICGSAPSLNDTWKDLCGDVWACNDAGWMLIDRGIIPKYVMVWDPQPLVVDCLRRTHPDTTYLVASMCDPSVFDRLKGHKVLIWHAWVGDALPLTDWLIGAEAKSRLLVGFGLKVPGVKLDNDQVAGTSAAVTRSMQFAPLMGYREIHVHGCDSSVREGLVHFQDLEVDKGQVLQAIWLGAKSIPGSRKQFVSTPQMVRQIAEFEPLMNALKLAGYKVWVHGEGAIPHLARLKGWHADSRQLDKTA